MDTARTESEAQPGAANSESPLGGSAREPGEPSARGGRQWLRWLAAVGWAVIALVVAHRLAPSVPISPLAAFAIGFAAVAFGALGAAWRCPAVGRRSLPLVVAPAAALWWLSRAPIPELEMAIAVTVCLLICCSLLGAVVGWEIEHPGHIVFVAIVSSAADVLSVFHPSGPSSAIAQSEVALSVLALPWPMLGTRFVEPFLGAGDVVFTSLYVACSRKHALPARRTLAALTLGFAATMVAVVALEIAVPALPFLGIAMLLWHPQARRPPERDRKRGYALAAAVVIAVAVLLVI